jgi:ankyrin repeat protein
MLPRVHKIVVVASCLLIVAIICQGCRPPDRGRELVNAAGLSKGQVIAALARGANVNQRSSSTFGWTPLISAIYHKREDVAELLIARGADPNLADAANETPLNWAISVWNNNTNLIGMLMRSGADPTRKSRYGADAYELARKQPNSEEILALLRQPGSDETTNAATRGTNSTR